MNTLRVFDEVVPASVAQVSQTAIEGLISQYPNDNELPAPKQFLIDCGLLPYFQDVANRVEEMGPFLRAQINPTSRLPSVHSHGVENALLYYVREDWQDTWMGGTIFLNESRTRITGLVDYVSRRIVVIPVGLVHSMLPVTNAVVGRRITITAFYGVNNANSAG